MNYEGLLRAVTREAVELPPVFHLGALLTSMLLLREALNQYIK